MSAIGSRCRGVRYGLLVLVVAIGSNVAHATAQPGKVADAYREVRGSVVKVVVRGLRFEEGPAGIQVTPTAGGGSGFAVGRGLVVTNYHVIEEATEIEVGLRGERAARARLVGTAPGFDLALLRVPFDEEDLPPIRIRPGPGIEVGDSVVAVSHPLGLEHSISVGVVSGLKREIPGTDLGSSLIQFDAAINPGQSGGPLVDLEGRVIGMTTAKILGAEAIGFAIPVDVIMAIVPDLQHMGHPFQPQIGISGVTVTRELAMLFGIPVDWGLLVERVEEESVGERAGLRHGQRIVHLGGHSFVLGGDVIVAVEGELVRGPSDLTRILITAEPGESIQLEVVGIEGHRTVDLEVPRMSH